MNHFLIIIVLEISLFGLDKAVAGVLSRATGHMCTWFKLEIFV